MLGSPDSVDELAFFAPKWARGLAPLFFDRPRQPRLVKTLKIAAISQLFAGKDARATPVAQWPKKCLGQDNF